jgi:hypothetical protein
MSSVIINLDTMSAVCRIHRAGVLAVEYEVTRQRYSTSVYDAEGHCIELSGQGYKLETLDAEGAPIIVRWIARGLHGLPDNALVEAVK